MFVFTIVSKFHSIPSLIHGFQVFAVLSKCEVLLGFCFTFSDILSSFMRCLVFAVFWKCKVLQRLNNVRNVQVFASVSRGLKMRGFSRYFKMSMYVHVFSGVCHALDKIGFIRGFIIFKYFHVFPSSVKFFRAG